MEKILVIDDDAEVRENLGEILSMADYEVATAADGEEGIALAKDIRPDLILCDVSMPRLDGYDVLECIQEIPEIALTPLIFLTGNSEPRQLRQGMELGADDYIIKPFDIADLLASIQTRLVKQAKVKHKLEEEKAITRQFQKLAQEGKQSALDRDNMILIKDRLLNKIVENLGDTVNKINLVASLLQTSANSPEQRSKYMGILKEETARQSRLLDEVIELQNLLKPENLEILQRYNLLS
ncbi:MAG: response regulator [Cyanobacteria bacterium RI_101]|jgi:DNA-binding response OmpR family regulator|nr:response regulator [Cyanobacteria bacterium RI_101]